MRIAHRARSERLGRPALVLSLAISLAACPDSIRLGNNEEGDGTPVADGDPERTDLDAGDLPDAVDPEDGTVESDDGIDDDGHGSAEPDSNGLDSLEDPDVHTDPDPDHDPDLEEPPEDPVDGFHDTDEPQDVDTEERPPDDAPTDGFEDPSPDDGGEGDTGPPTYLDGAVLAEVEVYHTMAGLTDVDVLVPVSVLDHPEGGPDAPWVRDPDLGAWLRRISTATDLGPEASELRFSYRHQSFSADSRFLLSEDLSNPPNYEYLRRDVELDYHPSSELPLGYLPYVPQWHPIAVDWLMEMRSPDFIGVDITRYDVVRLNRAAVATVLPTGGWHPELWPSRLSLGGRFIGNLGYLDGNDESAVIQAFDLIEGEAAATLSLTDLFAVDGPCDVPDFWAPEWGPFRPSRVEVSPLGRYLIVDWYNPEPGRCRGIEVFDIRTGAFEAQLSREMVRADFGRVSDWEERPEGEREFAVGFEYFHPGADAHLTLRWLPGQEDPDAFDAYTTLLPLDYDHVEGGTVSCSGPPDACVVATGFPPEGPFQALHGEILLVYPESGVTRRLAHHRTSLCGYDTWPHPSLSPDGRRIAFNSDWGEAVCDENVWGNSDIYMIYLDREQE